MSIVYQYYSQGSSFVISMPTNSANLLNGRLNQYALNHIAVVPTANAFVRVVQTATMALATTMNAEFCIANVQTIIPCVKGRSLSVLTEGTGWLYVTEYLGA